MIERITNADRENRGVSGLPDTPGLSASEMQARIDGLGNLACDKINEIIDAMNNKDGLGNYTTNIYNETTNTYKTLDDAIDSFNTEIKELKEKVAQLEKEKIISVEELPTDYNPDAIYLIQGEVTVS